MMMSVLTILSVLMLPSVVRGHLKHDCLSMVWKYVCANNIKHYNTFSKDEAATKEVSGN